MTTRPKIMIRPVIRHLVCLLMLAVGSSLLGADPIARGFTNVTWVAESGTVVWDASWDSYLFVRLDDGRVCRVGCRSKGDKTNGLKRGDRVAVEGQTRVAVEPRIVNARVDLLKRADREPPPQEIPFDELVFDPMKHPEFLARYGEYAAIRGRVESVDVRENDMYVHLAEGLTTYRVRVMTGRESRPPEGLVKGAVVRVVGPYLFYPHIDEEGTVTMDTPYTIVSNLKSLEVVEEAPWLTAERLAWILGGTLVVLLLLSAATLGFRVYLRRTRARAMEAERLRIAGDLHDGFMQQLIGVKSKIKTAEYAMAHGKEDSAQEKMSEAQKLVGDAQVSIRLAFWRILGGGENLEDVVPQKKEEEGQE